MSFDLYMFSVDFFGPRPEHSKVDQQIQDYLNTQKVASTFSVKELMKSIVTYSDDEKKFILEDLKKLAQELLPDSAFGQKKYLFTGGGPAAGKSILLNSLLRESNEYAHIDPHKKIYSKMSGPRFDKRSLVQKYPHWKNAVYFISSALVGIALQKNLSIAHKTSATSINFASHLIGIKNQGYNIHMIHLSTSLENCRIGENNRQLYDYPHWEGQNIESFYKGFHFNFPVYLTNCDEITLYFRETETYVVKAATIYPGNMLDIHNTNAYNEIITLHDKVCGDGSWARHLIKEGRLKIQST